MKNGFAVGRFVFIGVVLVCLCASRTTAATLDFETLPGGGPPTESMNISNQYQASFGMRFSTASTSSLAYSLFFSLLSQVTGPP